VDDIVRTSFMRRRKEAPIARKDAVKKAVQDADSFVLSSDRSLSADAMKADEILGPTTALQIAFENAKKLLAIGHSPWRRPPHRKHSGRLTNP
jgi:hypothetical protein